MNTTSATNALSAVGTRRVVGRHRRTRPRTLHLIDLENLLAGRVDETSVAQLWTEYRRVTAMRWDDHVVVSVSKKNAPATFFTLSGQVQRVVGENGADGADHALIDAVNAGWAAARFSQVMLASGDHIFSDVVRLLRAEGLHIVQVIGGGQSAAEIYRRCHSQLYLPVAQRRAQHLAQESLDRDLRLKNLAPSGVL